jgi:hypothetical protein
MLGHKMKKIIKSRNLLKLAVLSITGLFLLTFAIGAPAYAAGDSFCGPIPNTKPTQYYSYCCGNPPTATSINLGCVHKGNAIIDATFGIIKFLSDGVGLVVIASLIWAGIQYTGSRGDPQATANAMKRVQSNVMALLLYIFAYAILNYIVPGQVL